ncbi:hypothetical protein ACWDTI_09425 [Gordonia sp. NPDC003424]
MARLLEAAELGGLDAARNPKYWVCTSARELLDRGFTFEKDDYPDEPKEHYSVVLSAAEPTFEDAERFIEAFELERR